MPDKPDVSALAERIQQRDRAALARAITLVESSRPEHQRLAQQLVQTLLAHSGKAMRIGISGVPGVGKSTFIDAFGQRLIELGHRVAVLAVDPSSQRTGGSILGDKTRMATLGLSDEAFVRPSPTGGHLGGVTRVTRESMVLCEAADFDVVLVETVGVGQSETAVANMVDCYLVLMLPGAGDDLQGIKKGVLELADIIAVNKADGAQQADARHARNTYARALSILTPATSWRPVALTCSALSGDGLDKLWETITAHHQQLSASGELESRRSQQRLDWLAHLFEQRILDDIARSPTVSNTLKTVSDEVSRGELSVPLACDHLVEAYRQVLQS